jgi:hypothetical protein
MFNFSSHWPERTSSCKDDSYNYACKNSLIGQTNNLFCNSRVEIFLNCELLRVTSVAIMGVNYVTYKMQNCITMVLHGKGFFFGRILD